MPTSFQTFIELLSKSITATVSPTAAAQKINESPKSTQASYRHISSADLRLRSRADALTMLENHYKTQMQLEHDETEIAEFKKVLSFFYGQERADWFFQKYEASLHCDSTQSPMQKSVLGLFKSVLTFAGKTPFDKQTIIGIWGDFTKSNFHGKNCRNADFRGAKLDNANFERVNLSQANFSDTYIFHVNFKKAFLEGANFSSAIFCFTNFVSAILVKANLNQIQILGINNFFSANLSEAKLCQVHMDAKHDNDETRIFFDNANLTKADLSDSDFSCANFFMANLSMAKIIRTKFAGTSFIFTNLYDTSADGCEKFLPALVGNPIHTLRLMLHEYAQGGGWGPFFSLHFRTHHADAVHQFAQRKILVFDVAKSLYDDSESIAKNSPLLNDKVALEIRRKSQLIDYIKLLLLNVLNKDGFIKTGGGLHQILVFILQYSGEVETLALAQTKVDELISAASGKLDSLQSTDGISLAELPPSSLCTQNVNRFFKVPQSSHEECKIKDQDQSEQHLKPEIAAK